MQLKMLQDNLNTFVTMFSTVYVTIIIVTNAILMKTIQLDVWMEIKPFSTYASSLF